MNCRKCKRNGKDVEMKQIYRADTWIDIPPEINGNLLPKSDGRFLLKCPECGWSVSV